MSFFVGAVLGGPEVRTTPLVSAIQAVSRITDRLRGDGGDQPAIDLVFHVPGSMIKPPYEGLRTGKFSKKERILMIQVAVCENQVFTEKPWGIIFQAMRQAVDLAASVFSKSGIAFSREEHHRVIASLKEEIASVPGLRNLGS